MERCSGSGNLWHYPSQRECSALMIPFEIEQHRTDGQDKSARFEEARRRWIGSEVEQQELEVAALGERGEHGVIRGGAGGGAHPERGALGGGQRGDLVE